MRFIASLLLSAFVVLTLAIPAEAQYYRRDPRVGQLQAAIAGYDRYDPYYNSRYGDPRQTDPCYGADQFYQGVRGTIHAHNGAMHFRPCDPTNNRISTMGGGALAGLGGAAIGAAIGGRRGAAIGAVGGAVTGGILASRNTHDNCIDMTSVQSTVQQSGVPVSYQEQALIRPVTSPVDPLANITWLTINTTNFRAVVTDPNLPENHPKKRRLILGGGSMPLPDPAGEQPYTVVLLEPGRGKSNEIPGEILPSKDLQGWEISARQE